MKRRLGAAQATSERLIQALASAVLDGEAVDWVAAQSGADADARRLVKHLQLVAAVAKVHHGLLPTDGGGWSVLTEQERPRRNRWGHLQLLDRIGQGSYGEVFRAWDTRLDREVALKLLPAVTSGDEHTEGEIIREGQLLAKVRHANVVTIFGAERIHDRIGLWMELVRGQTLEELLKSGATFTVKEVVRVGLELARAVAAVHAAGLLHRDIKAQNVMRADDGRVVLMDFGSGGELADNQQCPAGTPLYLAPEVFEGRPATVQSDTYSLGVLLFHLLTGVYPVMESSLGELRKTHRQRRQTSVRTTSPEVPSGVARVVDRAVDPKPHRRYQTAEALAADLQALAGPANWRRVAYATLTAAIVAVATWQAWPDRAPVIAVLPFQNLSTESGGDVLAEGLTHEVVSSLAQIEGWTIRSLVSSLSNDEARNVIAAGRHADADFLLDASVQSSNGRLRLNTRLINVGDDSTIWAHTFDRDDGDAFAALDEVARALVNQLRLEVGSGQRRYQIDPSLELLFLKARGLQMRRQPPYALEAVALFEEIAARDRAYAPAVAALARSLGDLWRLNREQDGGAVEPRLEHAALEAVRLDPLLPDAQAALGILHTLNRQWLSAEAAFERAIEIDPSQGSLYADYAVTLLLPLGRLDRALEVLDDGRKVAPLSLDVRRVQALVQIESGLYSQAIENSRWVLEQDPQFPFVNIWLGRALVLSGRPDEALPIFSSSPQLWNYLGYLYAVTGRRDDAEALAARHPDDPVRQMMIYGGLGDTDRAFRALDRASVINPWRAATWMLRPEVAILRGDPRYQEVRRRLSLPD